MIELPHTSSFLKNAVGMGNYLCQINLTALSLRFLCSVPGKYLLWSNPHLHFKILSKVSSTALTNNSQEFLLFVAVLVLCQVLRQGHQLATSMLFVWQVKLNTENHLIKQSINMEIIAP